MKRQQNKSDFNSGRSLLNSKQKGALERASSDLLRKLPPQNIEAEQAVLGGVFLRNDIFYSLVDILSEDDFYSPANRLIYQSFLELYRENQPIDLVTVMDRLQKQGQLDSIGGPVYLTSLADSVASASNSVFHAQIVREKALRRKLIEASSEIMTRCFEAGEDIDSLLDESEQQIFSIAETKSQASFRSSKDLVTKVFQQLEQRVERKELVTGVPTSYHKFDEMTAGLQPTDLIIVAGRPSMGKCCEAGTEIVLSDGSIKTIEEIHKAGQANLLTLNSKLKFETTSPSAYIDDGIKPVFKVTTKLGRFVSTTLTHPFLTIGGWKPLGELQVGESIAVPRKIDVFGTKSMRECEVKLIAYLLGDGNLTNACPRFFNNNSKILDDFINSTEEFGGIVATLIKQKNRVPEVRIKAGKDDISHQKKIYSQLLSEKLRSLGISQYELASQMQVSPASVSNWVNGKYVPEQEQLDDINKILGDITLNSGINFSYFNKNALTVFLKNIGLWGKNSKEKFIPQPIFELPKQQMTLFLNRLFATDGWACVLKSGQVQLGFASTSQKMSEQIQHLLLRFGIISKLKYKAVKYKDEVNDCWQLDITDSKSISIFIEKIGILGKEQAVKKAQESIISRQSKARSDSLPVEVWNLLRQAKKGESWSSLAKRAGLKGYSNIHVGKRGVTRKRFQKMALALEDSTINNLAFSDIYWDEIVSIEPLGNKQVYDLTIPQTHNFVANDICVHNTAFALNVALRAAVIHEVPTAIFSLEMSMDQLMMRMLGCWGKVELSRLRTGFLDDEDWSRLYQAADNLATAPIYIDDTPALGTMELRSKCRRLKKEKGLGLVVVDYLQLMRASRRIDSREQEISEISRTLKAVAKEMDLPMVALSQLNRKVEERTNKRPMLSDLRESGAIEQDADLIVFLYRDDAYNKSEDNPKKGIAEIIIGKQRNGPVGTVELAYINKFTAFENLSDADVPEPSEDINLGE